jgi:hypothetical protein
VHVPDDYKAVEEGVGGVRVQKSDHGVPSANAYHFRVTHLHRPTVTEMKAEWRERADVQQPAEVISGEQGKVFLRLSRGRR